MTELIDQEPISELPPEQHKTRKPKLGLSLFVIGLAIILLALLYCSYRLVAVDKKMSAALADLQQQQTATASKLTTTEQALATVQEANQKANDLIASQTKTLTDLATASKGKLEYWQVAEAKYLVKLANDQLQFAGDAKRAVMLLEQAQQILQSLNEPTLTDLEKALAENIATVQAAKTATPEAIYLQLITLANEVSKLTLPIAETRDTVSSVPVAMPELPWWKQGLYHSWNVLKQIVVVKTIPSADSSLVMPDQKAFLLQNLQLQLNQAMTAILNQQPAIYKAALQNTSSWVQIYFTEDDNTKMVLTQLNELAAIDLTMPTLDNDKLMPLFDAYLNQQNQA